MAKIKIYGTLHNDTGEPIASADQIVDPATGKMVSELLGQGGESMTDEDVENLLSELFPAQ